MPRGDVPVSETIDSAAYLFLCENGRVLITIALTIATIVTIIAMVIITLISTTIINVTILPIIASSSPDPLKDPKNGTP